ncbi:unnamed protein product [Phytomonas sp. Hart1]|nr:unnamed protein product [Phytomonas sp. Hart1]|eukprot:CCW71681.1 unnamed protein product [Phytomonas sp. isolate Hart1]
MKHILLSVLATFLPLIVLIHFTTFLFLRLHFMYLLIDKVLVTYIFSLEDMDDGSNLFLFFNYT